MPASLQHDPRSPVHETKARILEAAFQRLAREGYGALSIREIGRDAGVNHALVNYHFKSKEQLVISVLDEANRRLLARQERLYASPGSYADKWAQARRFYENDLASGFVRVLMELHAASMSNPVLREAFAPRMNAWFDVVGKAVADAFAYYELDLPVSPQVVSTWICNFWLGTELGMLAGTGKHEAHLAALQAVEDMLRRLEAQRKSAAKRRARRRPPA
ncbi:TetR/AcrR family transcriptional regulator [Ramlibacter sp. AN1133]|uniref:TetR/AcrR family transcriptional regulator n=1 Tax=Ramlibacter sp. AN1133 TaxID=3133429 RepID=UPI0030BCC9A2